MNHPDNGDYKGGRSTYGQDTTSCILDAGHDEFGILLGDGIALGSGSGGSLGVRHVGYG